MEVLPEGVKAMGWVWKERDSWRGCDAGFAWGTNRVAQVERRDGGGTSGTR